MRFTVNLVGDDRLEVATEAGQRYTFPIAELRATRRPPKGDANADDLRMSSPLMLLEAARQAAEAYAIEHGLV